MIEIILRDDITSYKSKPFFGMSGRQLIVLLIVLAVLGLEIWFLYFLLNVPTDIGGLFLVATGVGIGYVGLSERDGIALTKLLIPEYRYRNRPNTAEHRPPDVVIYAPSDSDRSKDPWVIQLEEEVSDPKVAKKEAKKEVKLAKRDSEFIDEEGHCISAKKARQLRNIKLSNKAIKTKKEKNKKKNSIDKKPDQECA